VAPTERTLELTSDRLADYPLSDAGNAELFTTMFGDLVRFDHARSRWLVWETHRWRPDDDETVRRMALHAVRKRLQLVDDPDIDADKRRRAGNWAIGSESRSRIDALLSLARAMKPIADNGRDWDSTPGLLGVPNGVVDLRTGEQRDGRPEDRITMQAAVEYNPSARAPRWEQFIDQVFSTELVGAYLRRMAGYSITAEGTLHRLMILMGVGGNGKSTFFNAVRGVSGDYGRNISARAILDKNADAHTTELADFDLSRFATCEEIGNSQLNANRIKDISGGGVTTARRMYSNTTTFQMTWLLWLSTNGQPRIDDNSWATWRRVRVVDFPYIFKDDPNLEEELRREQQGILRWLIDGAVEFYEIGEGPVPTEVSEKTDEYRLDVDPLHALFEDGILVADEDAWTPTAILHGAYLRWADENNISDVRRFGQDGFAKAINGRFPRRKKQADGQQQRGFSGVRLGVDT
jgi:putative DNA primase/helicase